MSIVIASGTTEVDVELELDHYDALEQMDNDEIIDYCVSEFSHQEIYEKLELGNENSDMIAKEDILDYLVDEYYRGAFGEFDFDKLFDKIEIKQCQCPSTKTH